MKLLICDRCGCTDKPFQGCRTAPERGEMGEGGGTELFSFHQVAGFDICGPCFLIWWTQYQNLIESFLEGEEDTIKWETKKWKWMRKKK